MSEKIFTIGDLTRTELRGERNVAKFFSGYAQGMIPAEAYSSIRGMIGTFSNAHEGKAAYDMALDALKAYQAKMQELADFIAEEGLEELVRRQKGKEVDA